MQRGSDHITVGQLGSMTWAAVLAPTVGLLPAVTVPLAGEGAWLSTLIALPALLALSLCVRKLCGGENLAQAFQRSLGAGIGRALALLYLLWAAALLAVRLRLGGERLLLTGEHDGGLWFFILLTGAGAVWMAWGKLAAFARAARLFCVTLLAVLGGVIVLAAFQLKGENLWPIGPQDLPGVLLAAVPALGGLCYGIYAAFFLDSVTAVPGDRGVWTKWTAGGCVALSAMQLAVVGSFGPQLTLRLGLPFLTLAKSVGVEGAFQRLEGLVSALWLLGDLAVLTLLLLACGRLGQAVWPGAKRHTGVIFAGLLGLAGAAALREPIHVQELERTWVLAGNLVFGFLIPAGACLIGKLRKKK